MDLGLNHHVALVTGSNRGTGFIIASRLAAEGCRVILHAMEQPDLDSAAVLLKDSGASHLVSGDIGTPDGAASVASQVAATGLEPLVLVNNYGTAARGNWFDTSAEDWLDVYSRNTLSAALMAQHFAPAMKAAGHGRIINLGTIGSTRPNARMPHYYAAKGALATLTVSLAKELSGTSITVNLVSPGLIRTPEVEAHYADIARNQGWGDDFASAEAQIAEHYFPNPVGRFATREEVADLVVFLASDKAAFINAQNVRVDGGAVDIV